jgi:hypothetical protein
MCGVHHEMVESARPHVAESATPERTGQDGKQYPAKREPAESAPDAPEEREPTPVLGPPAIGMQFARMALMDLEQIREDDVERDAAFECVLAWISDHWTRRE